MAPGHASTWQLVFLHFEDNLTKSEMIRLQRTL